jgi:hypothetical protein
MKQSKLSIKKPVISTQKLVMSQRAPRETPAEIPNADLVLPITLE